MEIREGAEARHFEETGGRVMELVSTPIQHDLLAGCQDLVEGVASGHIIGLGVVVQLRGGKFFVDAIGRITKQPHSARGWTMALVDHFGRIAEERNHHGTTR
jgi:hypothetical protein